MGMGMGPHRVISNQAIAARVLICYMPVPTSSYPAAPAPHLYMAAERVGAARGASWAAMGFAFSQIGCFRP
jgi:hypothetical protein